MTTAIAKLDGLRAHVDDRGIDLALVERTETWLAGYQQQCGASWSEPGYVFYDNANAEIQFTWYFKVRSLGIAVSHQSIEYVKSWGPRVPGDIECDTITTPQKQRELWRWLREE